MNVDVKGLLLSVVCKRLWQHSAACSSSGVAGYIRASVAKSVSALWHCLMCGAWCCEAAKILKVSLLLPWLLLCRLMTQPVVTPSGATFDRSALIDWIRQSHTGGYRPSQPAWAVFHMLGTANNIYTTYVSGHTCVLPCLQPLCHTLCFTCMCVAPAPNPQIIRVSPALPARVCPLQTPCQASPSAATSWYPTWSCAT